ncbi:MAG: NAD(P)-binding protein [Desulfotignum sp.]|jgi:NADPH-dependent glutamate synthase beta subunit-like oxidoreductase|nr:NAD(P)-binding protein [Desulfotignum sp.]
MAKDTCPVQSTLQYLSDRIASGVLTDPKVRRICESIRMLVEEISLGEAGDSHMAAIDDLMAEFENRTPDDTATKTLDHLKHILSDRREEFVSHIETRNCPSHDCGVIAPSPCQMACPAGIDVPTYLALIAEGKDDQAIAVIREDNPLPWVCGLVCTRPCEMMCVRGRIDTPISIKFLKAFAAERALSDRRYTNPEPAPPNGKRICVVGAGPGGLSCAYYLALMGYKVEVIESLPFAGGMLMVGIPRYRLPREVIDREVAMIEDLGVTFSFNTRFGSDVTYEDMKTKGTDAFFLAIGAHKAWDLGIKGETDFPRVIDAITFLKNVAIGDRHAPGKHVVVIGGGNVAIDAARTSLRLGAEKVTIAYRRSREQMPADIEEVEQAEEEGIAFAFLTIPTEITGNDGRITGLACIKAELIAKKGTDRLAPVPILGKEFTIQADAVISAIGQYVDDSGMTAFDAVNWTRRGTIEVNHASMETSMPGVFAAGDAVSGPATVIEAIGGGKRAAEAIHRHLTGMPQPRMPKIPVRRRKVPMIEMTAAEKMRLSRPVMPMLNVDRRRTTFQQVELGYDEAAVRKEARRCLRCDVCRRCGKCVEVCRDKMGIDALHLGYLDFDHPVKTDFRMTAENCITCGACAANCENNAMTLEEKDGRRMLKLCGTILNEQEIQTCDACGARLPSAQYMAFISDKTADLTQKAEQRLLCNDCQRRLSAKNHVPTRPVNPT